MVKDLIDIGISNNVVEVKGVEKYISLTKKIKVAQSHKL